MNTLGKYFNIERLAYITLIYVYTDKHFHKLKLPLNSAEIETTPISADMLFKYESLGVLFI